jgi:hypothetical protein
VVVHVFHSPCSLFLSDYSLFYYDRLRAESLQNFLKKFLLDGYRVEVSGWRIIN